MGFDSKKFYQNKRECEKVNYLKNKTMEKYIRRIRMNKFLNNKQNKISFNSQIIYPLKNINNFANNTLYFIPFKDVTEPLWNKHKNGDCTHWCTFPHLWQTIWHSLYKII